MRTLVYLASGEYKESYESLSYDKIFLVDKSLNKVKYSNKVTGLRMDALESTQFFKDNNIQIDCLVILRESQGEGGETYNLCSDAVIGYFMSILPENFILICNDVDYYMGLTRGKDGKVNVRCFPERKISKCDYLNFVSLDLPYKMIELTPESPEYINPSNFTSLNKQSPIHVYSMQLNPCVRSFKIGDHLTIRIIQDSIWRHLEVLDHLYISFKPSYTPQRDFYTKTHPNATYYKQMEFGQKIRESIESGHKHIGFTPHYWYQYDRNYQKMLEDIYIDIKGELKIDFFYMNSSFKCRFIEKAIKTLMRR